ncbi:MAG TPA: hypothetical protein DCS82_03390, partial [Rhodospirillaceae bacterium]|nr:hypothetical protein [Rhodospirillaceae bacterium]
SIFQEGLRIPPVKLMAAGVLQQDIFDMVMLNTRTPLEREGDLKAQIATNNTGIRRIQDTFAAFGTETMFEAIEGMLDYAERRTRQEIAKIPDGTYENTDYLDNDGVKDIEVKLKVAITIKGDRISFDFTGCDPQISGGRNMPYVTTLACVYYSVKAMTDPYLPPNAGYFRAIDVVAPKGTVVNCDAPAATSDRAASSNIMGDVLMGAWAKVLPERAMAGCGPLAGYIFSGLDPLNGLYYVDYETYAGASGGFMHMDGKDAVRVHTSGASNLPVESVEQEYPLTVERYELVADSGGPGRHRGGLATVRDIRMWGEQPELAGRGLRQTRPALGMFGGRDGTVGYFKIEPGTDNEQKLPGSFSQLPVEPGTMARVQTPSGAGYGPPWERDPDKVLDDIRSGKISAPAAERDYGVVMENGEIDEDKTASRRAQMEAEADGS